MGVNARRLNLVIVIGVVGLLFAALSVWRQVQQYRSEWLIATATAVTATGQEIDHRLQERRRKVEALRLLTEEALKHGPRAEQPSAALIQDDNGFYQNDVPAGQRRESSGRLSGASMSLANDTALRQEIDAVWQLVPLFRLNHQQDPSLPWLYYLSAREFILLYPWAPLEQYRYDSSIQELEFWRSVIPANNPRGELRWTSVYEDGAGKGLMITASAPVYVGEQFKGIVAIDVLLTEFQQVLASGQQDIAMLLFDNTGQLVAQSGVLDARLLASRQAVLQPLGLAEASIDLGPRFQQSASWHLMQVSIDNGAATLLALKPATQVWRVALIKAAPFVLLIVLGVMLLVMLVRSEHAARKIEQLTITDGLTGAYNRRHFDAMFDVERERALRAHRCFAVVMADIDQFKSFNDHYGHLAGDDALRRSVQAMTQATRRGGDLLFRWGGEEFAVLLSVESTAQAEEVAERIRLSVSQLQIPHEYSPHRVLTISLGIALTTDPAHCTRNQLIREADQALYDAKAAGRNRSKLITVQHPEEPAAS